MPNIHLVMPFSRLLLKETLIELYRPMGVIWHPIMFKDELTDFPDEDWIDPVLIAEQSGDCKVMMPGTYKRNRFIESMVIDEVEKVDDDYYLTVDDDDFYEPGVMEAIKKETADIVIISMKRGHNIPADAPPIRKYPTFTLLAGPNNVAVGKISAQQMFVKGRIFRAHLHNEESHSWDGELAVHYKDSGEQIAYRPNLFALFNYFEPGRWDQNNKPKDIKIAFGVMVNDLARLDMVFRLSEIDPKISAYTINQPTSATKGLNKLLELIETEDADIAILAHQDMFFRQGWLDQVKEQIAKLPDSWIVCGVIGKDLEGEVVGEFHDMRMPLHFSSPDLVYPVAAACFDEAVLIFNVKNGFRFDETMDGFDLYGTLAVLQTWEMGQTAWIIDAFCEHYCTRQFTWLPDKTFEHNFRWLHERFPDAPRIDTTVLGVRKQDSRPRYDELINQKPEWPDYQKAPEEKAA